MFEVKIQPHALSVHSKRRAFSLVELTIVLSISAIVLGGIWVTASLVNTKYQAGVAIRQVMGTVNNIRDNYAAVLQFPTTPSPPWGVSGTDVTNYFGGLNLISPDVSPSGAGTYNSSLGSASWGTFHIQVLRYAPGGFGVMPGLNSFRIQLVNIRQAGCINLLSNFPSSDVGVGLEAVTVNGVLQAFVTAMTSGVPVWSTTVPFAPAAVSAWCSGADEPILGTNEVDLDFKLHP